jgi:hypothetical protein
MPLSVEGLLARAVHESRRFSPLVSKVNERLVSGPPICALHDG